MAFLQEPLVEHRLERINGAPTPSYLPQTITKPEDLGFGSKTYSVIDFGFSFRYGNGAVYKAENFSEGAVKAIEIEKSDTTDQPLKVDSWDIV